jgi:hypothetical protein
MPRVVLVLMALLVARAAAAAAPQTTCDSSRLRHRADTARDNIIAGIDGAAALEAWRDVLESGGAVGWTVTEYNVDPRSVFLFAFDRAALRIYRAGAFRDGIEDAKHGCIDPAIPFEAAIPWSCVREIEAANWVIIFKLREPVEIRSDRGDRERVTELKAFFHGASGGELTYHYNIEYRGRTFWNLPVYEVQNLRGIAVGPTDFQRRLQFVLARAVDPEGRIALKRKGRGAGW